VGDVSWDIMSRDIASWDTVSQDAGRAMSQDTTTFCPRTQQGYVLGQSEVY
jgi:hypothetical protein